MATESRQCLRPAVKAQILTVLKWGEKTLENEVETSPVGLFAGDQAKAYKNLKQRLSLTSRLIGDVERIPECE